MNRKFIMVCSFDRYSGKTIFILGLAHLLKEWGYRVGYFKPLGFRNYILETGGLVDEDVFMVKKLLNLYQSVDELSPFMYHYDFICKAFTKNCFEEIKNSVTTLAEKIAEDKDVVFIEGHGCMWTGLSIGLSSLDVSKLLDAPLIVLIKYDPVFICDRVLIVKSIVEQFNVNCIGVVIIGASRDEATLISSLLGRIGNLRFKILGILPPIRSILPLTIREISEAIDAKILVYGGSIDREIENLLIGAMTSDSAMRYFRVTPNKAVITGGDRTDIILTALKTDTYAVILTGDIYPEDIVIKEANKRGVSLLLSPYDTYTTVRKIEKYRYTIKYFDKRRIQKFRDALIKLVDVESILNEIKQ